MSVSYGDLNTVRFRRETCRGHLLGRGCERTVEHVHEVLAHTINPKYCLRVRCKNCGTINACYPTGQPVGVDIDD